MTYRFGDSSANAEARRSEGPTVGDAMTFARAWAAEPRRTGAILPSGKSLSKLITAEITADTGPVLELGAGTGVFTESLLRRGVRQDRITLIESTPAFARLLRLRFPRARVLLLDARSLIADELYQGRPLGAVISGLPLLSQGRPLGAVISGLPLLSLSSDCVEQVLRGSFAYMQPSANLFQFTYSPFCPVPRAVLNRLGLEATRVGWTFWNLPPASVYRIRRRQFLSAQTGLRIGAIKGSSQARP